MKQDSLTSQVCSVGGCLHNASGEMPRPGICIFHQDYLALERLPKEWPENWHPSMKPSAAQLTAWGRSELLPVYWPKIAHTR